MKKFNKFATAGMMMLAGTMGFAGCSSDDELADVNPTYDGKSVKAQFSINIPARTTQSRMTTGEAQETEGTFLGMTGINLVPLTVTGEEDIAAKTWSTVALADINAKDDWTNASLHAKVYNDVQFALGTNKVLFYGKAKTEKTESGLDMSAGATVGQTTFKMVSPYESTNVTAIQTYLTGVLNDVDAALTASVTVGNVSALRDAFRAKRGTEYKVIAGSSQKILALMNDLYTTVKASQAADPVNSDNYAAILEAITKYFTVDDNTGALSFKKEGSTQDGIDDYPACVHIPQGAVAVQYTEATEGSNDGFKYTTSDINSGSGFSMTGVEQYRKPSSLYYFVNSAVGTLDEVWLAENLKTATSWDGDGGVVGKYTGSSVQSTTRSIILKDKVQYGVAALKSTVKAATGPLVDESGASISLEGITITGILVGDQKDVDWQFKPTTTSGTYVVYDGVFAEGENLSPALTTMGTSTGNFTLLLENPVNNKVKVAVEFENNSGDFYGKDHMLVSKGTKFYLIAELDPKGTTEEGKTVFQQDYMTTATFTVKNLANAYTVVPDLRSPKLEFGLAVDLQWQTGMSFDVEFE